MTIRLHLENSKGAGQMNLINIENITKYFTDTPLFENASFTVDEAEKIGIIGINGTGKTTLLKMLVGMEEPDTEPSRGRTISLCAICRRPLIFIRTRQCLRL